MIVGLLRRRPTAVMASGMTIERSRIQVIKLEKVEWSRKKAIPRMERRAMTIRASFRMSA